MFSRYGFAEDLLTLASASSRAATRFLVREFISRQLLDQHLTVDVLEFLQLIENQKNGYGQMQPVGIGEFAKLAEQSQSTEQTIGTCTAINPPCCPMWWLFFGTGISAGIMKLPG